MLPDATPISLMPCLIAAFDAFRRYAIFRRADIVSLICCFTRAFMRCAAAACFSADGAMLISPRDISRRSMMLLLHTLSFILRFTHCSLFHYVMPESYRDIGI